MVERIGIRKLKDRLSEYVSRAKAGETVLVTDRGLPVARLGPPASDGQGDLRALADRIGTDWAGGKPLGLSPEAAEAVRRSIAAHAGGAAERLPDAQDLSAAIIDERDGR